MAAVISKEAIVDLLISGIPDAEWLLSEIESQDGWLKFPPYLSSLIKNLKIECYPLLYLNESAMGGMLLKGFLTDNEIKEFSRELELASPEERGIFMQEFLAGLYEGIDQIDIPKTAEDQAHAQKCFEALSPKEKEKSIKISQCFFCCFFSNFYQMLSVMVHGEKLTSLIAQAMAGNDEAFAKAVRIDGRILHAIPYFSNRFARAQDEADSDFFDLLSYRMAHAPYRGEIRHKSLWYAFAVLDYAGLLDTLKHREILDICDQAGVGGYENKIQSVKNLSDRLRAYREFQKRGIVTTS